MNDTVNRQILLVEKPTGKLGPEHFKMVSGKVPEPKDGEVLVKTRYISLDAANRAWMHGATYRAAVETNTVMAGGSIAEVIASKASGLAPGDLVFGDTGWQDYAAVPSPVSPPILVSCMSANRSKARRLSCRRPPAPSARSSGRSQRSGDAT